MPRHPTHTEDARILVPRFLAADAVATAKKAYGDQLRTFMHQQGLTCAEVAHILGSSNWGVHLLLRGKASLERTVLALETVALHVGLHEKIAAGEDIESQASYKKALKDAKKWQGAES